MPGMRPAAPEETARRGGGMLPARGTGPGGAPHVLDRRMGVKIRVGVFFGGNSVEHEVSIISAVQAMRQLDREKYDRYLDKITANIPREYQRFYFELSV